MFKDIQSVKKRVSEVDNIFYIDLDESVFKVKSKTGALPVIYNIIQNPPKAKIVEYPEWYKQPEKAPKKKPFESAMIKEFKIKNTSAKSDASIKKRILEYRAGLIDKEELTRGLTERDGLWYYHGHIVFCNCLLGEPCPYDNDSPDVGKLDMYIQIYGFNILQQMLPLITDSEKQQQTLQTEMEAKLKNVFTFEKFAKATKKEFVQYITNISILVFYKFYHEYFNVMFSDQVYSALKAEVRQNVANMIKTQNLDDIVEQFYNIIKQVFDHGAAQDVEYEEIEEDETGQKQQERDAEES